MKEKELDPVKWFWNKTLLNMLLWYNQIILGFYLTLFVTFEVEFL